MSAEQGDPHRLAAFAALTGAAVLAILSVDIVLSQFPPGTDRPRRPRDCVRGGLVRPDPHRGARGFWDQESQSWQWR